MERSLTARGAIARLTLPLGLAGGLRMPRPRARSRRPAAVPLRGRPRRLSGALAVLGALLSRSGTRIALVAVLIVLPLLGGGYLLLRHSSLVAVRHVQVSGVSGAEAPAIVSALERAGRHMSTLDVHPGALRAAVAQFRVVRDVTAVAHFPHGLSIHVIEQLPVATLLAGGVRTAVAADGVVLGPALLNRSLPRIAGWVAPAPGAQLHDRGLLAAAAVLGAAPHRLGARAVRAYVGPQGLTVAMRSGLVVYFGDGSRAHAKWLALAAVLADHSSAGAIYVDVRVPARPAAGFPAGAGPQVPSSSAEALGGSERARGSEPASGTESAVGALAEKLAPPPSSTAAEGSPSTGTAGGATPSEAGSGEASSPAGEAGAPSSSSAGGASETAPPSSSNGAAEAPAAGG